MSLKFLYADVAFYFYKATLGLALNAVVMSELVILAATWIFEISYRCGYVGLLVLYLLLLLKPRLIVEV